MSCDKRCVNRYSNIDFDFGTPSRFDLEVAINDQMDITENLNSIIEDVLDGDGINLDPDELVNTLQGVINLHTLKYSKLWRTFTNLFQLDNHTETMYDLGTEEENISEDDYID